MADTENRCERCGDELEEETGLCPECDEPAPSWLIYTVYVLIALFVIGLVYRLIWP
jgi:RNA polymerase subunit RPABC4/transcription elongation factor Spt4